MCVCLGRIARDVTLATTTRGSDAHRFIRADATELATTLWALNHGIVTLQLAGMLTADQAIATLSAGGASLFKAHGDDARATGSSFRRARQRASLEG